MKQALGFAKTLTERSSSSDIMKNMETLKQRFEVLRETEIPKHYETSFVKFTAASVKEFKLGFIHTIPAFADAKRSTLEGLKQTLQAGYFQSSAPLDISLVGESWATLAK